MPRVAPAEPGSRTIADGTEHDPIVREGESLLAKCLCWGMAMPLLILLALWRYATWCWHRQRGQRMGFRKVNGRCPACADPASAHLIFGYEDVSIGLRIFGYRRR